MTPLDVLALAVAVHIGAAICIVVFAVAAVYLAGHLIVACIGSDIMRELFCPRCWIDAIAMAGFLVGLFATYALVLGG